MRNLLYVFFLSNCFILKAQNKIEPIVALNYTPNYYFAKISGDVSAGIVLKRKISLETHFGYCKFEDSPIANKIGIDFVFNSYSIGYRFFEKYKLSPILNFNYGFQIYSNDKGEIIDQKARMTDLNGYEAMGYFNGIKSFGTLSVNVGYKLKFMEFYAGCGYRINRLSYRSTGYSPVNVIWKIRYWEYNLGVRFFLGKIP